MFNTDLARVALAAVGALVLTTTTVGAAVAPGRLAETAPVVYAKAAPLGQGAAHV